MALLTDREIENIIRLAKLWELEDEAMEKLDLIRDEIDQVAGWMSKEDFKQALKLYNKNKNLEPWNE